jgi:hypothetical protein
MIGAGKELRLIGRYDADLVVLTPIRLPTSAASGEPTPVASRVKRMTPG